MVFRMRIVSAVLLSGVTGLLATAPAVAGTLVGSTANVRFAHGYVIGKGYSELGVAIGIALYTNHN
jgi:hypothetical protein